MRISRVRDVVLAVSLLSMPFVAAAACCPSDGNGIALAKSGMGESLPLAVNLSQDPNWLVYGFERDGISYYQVNDLAGQVRVIVGKIDDQFFTLPAGKSPRAPRCRRNAWSCRATPCAARCTGVPSSRWWCTARAMTPSGPSRFPPTAVDVPAWSSREQETSAGGSGHL